eukprot:tig00000880_g5182.t1
MSLSATDLYRLVIDDVISKLRSEFTNQGADEGVLAKLQEMWELKLLEAGVMEDVYLPGNNEGVYGVDPAYAAGFAGYAEAAASSSNAPDAAVKLPQVDGAHDMSESGSEGARKPLKPTAEPVVARPAVGDETVDRLLLARWSEAARAAQSDTPADAAEPSSSSAAVPPAEGGSTAEAPARRRRQVGGQADGAGRAGGEEDDERAEGGDDLGSSDDDDDETNVDPETDHLILSQFDKVARTKNKWKVQLREGIMHLNGRDYIFAKANGEFTW